MGVRNSVKTEKAQIQDRCAKLNENEKGMLLAGVTACVIGILLTLITESRYVLDLISAGFLIIGGGAMFVSLLSTLVRGIVENEAD